MFFRIMPAISASMLVLLASCAKEEGPQIAPVDLVPSSLSPSGCLDLATTTSMLRSMGADTRLRIATTKVHIDGMGLRRNLIGEISFSNYRYAEKAVRDSANEWPELTQNACESVAIRSGPAGERLYKILPGEDPAAIELERDDGYKMKWKIEGPRHLTITTTASIMDRCPEYTPAKATTEIEYKWGTPDEVSALDQNVSRSMLRAISMVVVDMPKSLLTLATMDPVDLVKAPTQDLARLTRATIDPELQDCPYRAEPPSGAEPPPPPAGTQLPQ